MTWQKGMLSGILMQATDGYSLSTALPNPQTDARRLALLREACRLQQQLRDRGRTYVDPILAAAAAHRPAYILLREDYEMLNSEDDADDYVTDDDSDVNDDSE